MAQSSGSSQLDTSVLRAARLWKFAPPFYKTRPVEVESRVEVRFNRN
jgi:TonB family protein